MNDVKPPALSYQSALPLGHEPVWPGHRVVLAVSMAMWVLFVVIATCVIPRFETVFKDFKTELPTITIIILKVSRWCARDFGWLLGLPLAGMPFLVSYLLDRAANGPTEARRRSLWVIVGLVAAVVAALVFVAIALYAPWLTIVQSVSGSVKK